MDISLEVIETKDDARLMAAWRQLATMILDGIEQEPSPQIIAPILPEVNN